MNIRVIQWNIYLNSNAEKIAQYLAKKINGYTIINLQEVRETTNSKILTILQPDDSAYSLDKRTPGKFEGKNRKLGVATYVFGGKIKESNLLYRSVFPERTLFTILCFEKTNIRTLNFHSLTGVGYKKGKSSNFASIADFIHDSSLDLFTCDANEPQFDSLNDSDIEFFDNGDKGKKASLIFGKNKVHNLHDAFKLYLLNNGNVSHDEPLATSYITNGKTKTKRRYDHIYCKSSWEINNISYPFDKSKIASSDHSSVIGDFTINDI